MTILGIGAEPPRVFGLAERLKDRPEGATLFSIAARMRDAKTRLTEGME